MCTMASPPTTIPSLPFEIVLNIVQYLPVKGTLHFQANLPLLSMQCTTHFLTERLSNSRLPSTQLAQYYYPSTLCRSIKQQYLSPLDTPRPPRHYDHRATTTTQGIHIHKFCDLLSSNNDLSYPPAGLPQYVYWLQVKRLYRELQKSNTAKAGVNHQRKVSHYIGLTWLKGMLGIVSHFMLMLLIIQGIFTTQFLHHRSSVATSCHSWEVYRPVSSRYT